MECGSIPQCYLTSNPSPLHFPQHETPNFPATVDTHRRSGARSACYERPLFLHLRYSSREKELDGVDEAIRLARDSGARVHIDHLHSTGGTFHMEHALLEIVGGKIAFKDGRLSSRNGVPIRA